MTHELLRHVGEALYGARWQSELARALEVSDRTMRRWASDAGAIPDGVDDDLRRLCEKRGAEISRAAARLDGAVIFTPDS